MRSAYEHSVDFGLDFDSGYSSNGCAAFEKKARKMRSLGMQGMQKSEKMSTTIADVLNYDGPALCVVWVDPAQPIVPRQANYKTPEGQMASRPLEDMRPLLEREELEEIMSVSKEQ